VKKEIAVVGAVLIVDGRILCTRRGTGPLAGLWEFPGGKVEPGEEPREALVREIHEELGCAIDVGDEVTTTRHEYDFATIALTTYACSIVAGTPVLTEHTEARWLAPGDLGELDWAPADVPAVELLRTGT